MFAYMQTYMDMAFHMQRCLMCTCAVMHELPRGHWMATTLNRTIMI